MRPLAPIFLSFLVLAGCLGAPASEDPSAAGAASAANTGYRLTLEAKEEGERVRYTATLARDGPGVQPRAELGIAPPDGMVLVEGNLSWRGDVAPGQRVTLTAVFTTGAGAGEGTTRAYARVIDGAGLALPLRAALHHERGADGRTEWRAMGDNVPSDPALADVERRFSREPLDLDANLSQPLSPGVLTRLRVSATALEPMPGLRAVLHASGVRVDGADGGPDGHVGIERDFGPLAQGAAATWEIDVVPTSEEAVLRVLWLPEGSVTERMPRVDVHATPAEPVIQLSE